MTLPVVIDRKKGAASDLGNRLTFLLAAAGVTLTTLMRILGESAIGRVHRLAAGKSRRPPADLLVALCGWLVSRRFSLTWFLTGIGDWREPVSAAACGDCPRLAALPTQPQPAEECLLPGALLVQHAINKKQLAVESNLSRQTIHAYVRGFSRQNFRQDAILAAFNRLAGSSLSAEQFWGAYAATAAPPGASSYMGGSPAPNQRRP